MKEKTIEKILEYGGNLLMAVVVFAVGMALIKLALKITEKALGKTKLDK